MYPLRSGPHSYKHRHMRQLARAQRTPNPVCIAHALESAHASTTACARAHPRTRFSRHILARLDEHQASPPWRPSTRAELDGARHTVRSRSMRSSAVCAQVDWPSTLKMKVELGGSGAPAFVYVAFGCARAHTQTHTQTHTQAHAHAHTPRTGGRTCTHTHTRMQARADPLLRAVACSSYGPRCAPLCHRLCCRRCGAPYQTDVDALSFGRFPSEAHGSLVDALYQNRGQLEMVKPLHSYIPALTRPAPPQLHTPKT